jgi:hypothetical protein
MTEKTRRAVRAGLVYLTVSFLVVGLWAALDPQGFYDGFPGGGRQSRATSSENELTTVLRVARGLGGSFALPPSLRPSKQVDAFFAELMMEPEERQERHGIVRGNDMDKWLAQQFADVRARARTYEPR